MKTTSEDLQRLIQRRTMEIEMDLERQGKTIQVIRKRRKQRINQLVTHSQES